MDEIVVPASKDAGGLAEDTVRDLTENILKPLAADVAENARPKTDEFINNVMRPALEDFMSTLEKQADELAEKVWGVPCVCLSPSACLHSSWTLRKMDDSSHLLFG